MSDHETPFDKKFLRRNELADVLAQTVPFFERNKTIVIGVIVAVLLGAVGLVFVKHQAQTHVMDFNTRLAAVAKSPQKVLGYQSIIKDFADIPGVNLVRLKLAEALIENQKTDEALAVLSEGVKAGGRDVLTTLLLIKELDIYKTKKDYAGALTALNAGRKNILSAYANTLAITEADLLLLSGKKEDARKILTALTTAKPEIPKEGADAELGDDGSVAAAKEKLLLLDLGVL
jgi:predicted negative regulator of RcsB-dependent stress response